MQLDIQRWNYKTREYDEYTPDPSWRIILYTTDMDAPINCANCGKAMTYGEGYTSKELHTSVGLGYPVDGECYEDELVRARDARVQ